MRFAVENIKSPKSTDIPPMAIWMSSPSIKNLIIIGMMAGKL